MDDLNPTRRAEAAIAEGGFPHQPEERLNLIYITGLGRTGSTLLELLLNGHSQIVTCGEMQQWPRQILAGGTGRCGCHLALRECSFWEELRRRVDPLAQPAPQIHHFWRPDSGWLSELSERIGQLRRASPDAPTRRQIAVYADNNYRIFKAYRDLWRERCGSEPVWMVDASKNPYRLWWLLESGRFRIKVVHLVRDPCGFVCSTARMGRAEERGSGRMRRAFVQAAVWTFVNNLAREVVARKASPEDCIRVSYEALCRDPERTLAAICGVLGCGYEPRMRSVFRSTLCHAVSGNRMRFESRGIELDERWRRALTRGEQWLVRGTAGLPGDAVLALLRARRVQRAIRPRVARRGA